MAASHPADSRGYRRPAHRPTTQNPTPTRFQLPHLAAPLAILLGLNVAAKGQTTPPADPPSTYPVVTTAPGLDKTIKPDGNGKYPIKGTVGKPAVSTVPTKVKIRFEYDAGFPYAPEVGEAPVTVVPANGNTPASLSFDKPLDFFNNGQGTLIIQPVDGNGNPLGTPTKTRGASIAPAPGPTGGP